jgi:hypothetical protein
LASLNDEPFDTYGATSAAFAHGTDQDIGCVGLRGGIGSKSWEGSFLFQCGALQSFFSHPLGTTAMLLIRPCVFRSDGDSNVARGTGFRNVGPGEE